MCSSPPKNAFQSVSRMLVLFLPHPGFQLFYWFWWLPCPIQNAVRVSVPGPVVNLFVFIGPKKLAFWKRPIAMQHYQSQVLSVDIHTDIHINVYASQRPYFCRVGFSDFPWVWPWWNPRVRAARSLSLRQAQDFRTRKPIPTSWGRWHGVEDAWVFHMNIIHQSNKNSQMSQEV